MFSIYLNTDIFQGYFTGTGAIMYSWKTWVKSTGTKPLRWRHNGRDSVSNHQPHDCLLNRLFRRKSKKTSKLRVTGREIHRGPVISRTNGQ